MENILKDGLEYLVELGKKLSPIQELTINGRKYTNRELREVAEPRISALRINTLQSLIELISDGFEGAAPDKHVVHVVDHAHVQVVTKTSNHWKLRETLADCILADTTGMAFGSFLDQERFLIGLMASFSSAGDREELARIAGNATAEQVVTLVDDGITQAISMRVGASMKETSAIKGLVQLAPWRTFRDIDQPISTFLFRVKKVGDLPQFALFEADGGKWKLDAIESIARKLSAGLTKFTVVS